ncbi:MAG: hypothetical protein EZS28_012774 [Streblomastix strix]|uniref:Uncharacterized protein n=1 Tax=Streblomastix strix TaxID=222440 RepID=A0A5J4WBG6_9EUKA|nr:MAG: hypothetical protein EZS28_012774 [Streblomastix strix]
MHSDIFNVGPGEVIQVSDFKENFDLNLERDQEGREFNHKSSVTCLSVIADTCNDYARRIKQVYTILSRQEGICSLSELIAFFDQKTKDIKSNEDPSVKSKQVGDFQLQIEPKFHKIRGNATCSSIICGG